MTQLIHLDGNSLTLEEVIAVARHGAQCELDEQAKEAVIASRKIVDDIVREKRVVYGVTTGFGSLCNVSISPEDTVQLQENLIRTHSSGFGDPLPEDAVRAIMLIRINSLLKGYSGIRLSTVEKLLELLNKGVTPYIPEKGSLGASGDITSPFEEDLHTIRPQSGQLATARNIRNLLEGSKNTTVATQQRVQDPYTLRCIPQIHGASKDSIAYVKEKVEIEINSVTDNPIITKEGHVISGGNFHGEPMAQPFDFLGIALSEIGNVSERRVERLVNSQLSKLPSFLVKHPGLNSGFMITQYACASLASENKILSHPASVDSIPSCENQEDFVSMGTTAARKAAEILKNSRRIVATEIMAACQALDLKPENHELGKGTKPAYDLIRNKVSFIEFDKDIEIFEELNKASAVVESEEFLATIEKAVDLSIQY